MNIPSTIADYLRRCSQELGERILHDYPALQAPGDPISDRFNSLLRTPFAAQRLAVMGIVKRWLRAKAAAVIAECGTGKTLMALSALHVHSAGRPYTALVMAPPNIVGKWCREVLITIPGARVFTIDGLRTPGTSNTVPHGVNEVRYRNGRIAREGLHTTLTDLRLRKNSKSARERWQKICPGPCFWVVGRDRAKLSYFWKHSYSVAQSGPCLGSVINPDSGAPLIVNDERVLATEFEKIRRSEILGGGDAAKDRRAIYSPLWQADGKRIRRFAPLEFIGRYMKDFFDYGIADEVHELSNLSAGTNNGEERGRVCLSMPKTLGTVRKPPASTSALFRADAAPGFQSESSHASRSWSRLHRGGLDGRPATFSSALRLVSRFAWA